MYTDIVDRCNALAANFSEISEQRKMLLDKLSLHIRDKYLKKIQVQLVYICTHNSRRSHLSQIWTQTAAAHFNIKNVFCYSGGTESTALFPVVAKTLVQHGFKIKTIATGNNPIYTIKYGENEHPIIGFSKTYDDEFNPQSQFAAILTCSQADDGCPYIAGAENRFAITFEDPKAFDDIQQQYQKYQERSLQIATEMCYVFSQIKPY